MLCHADSVSAFVCCFMFRVELRRLPLPRVGLVSNCTLTVDNQRRRSDWFFTFETRRIACDRDADGGQGRLLGAGEVLCAQVPESYSYFYLLRL